MRDVTHSPLAQLVRAGIAPGRARRILREFAEHRADLIAEALCAGEDHDQASRFADGRLGSEADLIASLACRSEIKSFSRRRPAIAFGIAPLLYFAAAFCVSLLGFVALVAWRKAQGDAVTRATLVFLWVSHYGALYLTWVLPLLAALALAFFAARRREASLWPYVGILITCFVGALTNFEFYLPPMAMAPSMTAGLGLSIDHLQPVLLRTITTAALALVAWAWVRRTQRREIHV